MNSTTSETMDLSPARERGFADFGCLRVYPVHRPLRGWGPVFYPPDQEPLPAAITHVALVDLDYARSLPWRDGAGAWFEREHLWRLGDAITWSLVEADAKRGHGLVHVEGDVWLQPDLSSPLTHTDFSDGRCPGVLTGASLFQSTAASYRRATRSESEFNKAHGRGKLISVAKGRRG